MAHPKRIPVDAIAAMKKTLDALPDKNLGKTQEEALTLLNAHILKACSKGYSIKELAAIMTEGNVAVSAPTLRAHACPARKKERKAKPPDEAPKKEAAAPEKSKTHPAQKTEKEPSFYTPDIPDTEL